MSNRKLYWVSLVGITLFLLASIMHLSYKEDIEDFLPLSETDRQRMAVYQDISGMNRLFVVFVPAMPSRRRKPLIALPKQ